MLRNLLTIFHSPDEGGGGGDAATLDTAATSVPAENAAVDGASTKPTGEDPASSELPERSEPEVKVDPKYAREVARLGRNLNQAHEELRKYRESYPPPTGQPQPFAPANASHADIYNHPAIRGLQQTEDGLVLYRGMAITPELALEQVEINQKLAAFEEDKRARIEAERADKNARIEAEHTAKIEAITAEIGESVKAGISQMFTDAMPDLKGKPLQIATGIVLNECNALLADATGGDIEKLTEEIIISAAREAFLTMRTTLGTFAEVQLASNEAYKNAHKTKQDGTAGVPGPVDESKLTRTQRQALQAARSRLAEQAAEASRAA